MYAIDSSYSDGCNCHPDYHEIFADVASIVDLANYVADTECDRWTPCRDDLFVRRELTDEDWGKFLFELEDSRIRTKLRREKEREALVLKRKKDLIKYELDRAKASYELLKGELSVPARSAWEAAISKLQRRLDEC